MGTIVVKFGGTSLASAEQFKKVREIIEMNPDRRIVVASAPGKRFKEDIKVTDMLLECYEIAARGENFEEVLGRIKGRFQDIITDLNVEFPLDEEIDILRKHLQGRPEKDYMASRGEYLNSRILASYLGFTFVDPAWCVCFDKNGVLDEGMTRRAMRASLRPLSHAVVAGFYGADTDDRIRTFSRGGSDVTGSLAAMAVQADLYENWTDVSGLLAADPRIVDKPKAVEYISYRELRTLSYMGASVLHSDAILPASRAGIAINIRNTNRPEDAGTMIVRKLPHNKKKYPITGVAGRTGMMILQVEKVMSSDGAGFSALMLDILKDLRIPFEYCLTGIDTITIIMRNDFFDCCREQIISRIQGELSPDFIGIKENLSIIAVTGEKGTETSHANVRVLEALADRGIEISTINQGAGKLNLLIGVPDENYEESIRAIYGEVERGHGMDL